MSDYIDVKLRVDGTNVKWIGSCWKLPYRVESYPNHHEGGYSVLVDISSDDMVKTVQDNDGYEVIRTDSVTEIVYIVTKRKEE